MTKQKNYNFCVYHSFLTLKRVKRVKIGSYHVENTASNVRRLEKPRSREPSQPALSYEHIENSTKDLEERRNLGHCNTMDQFFLQSILSPGGLEKLFLGVLS